MKKKYMIELSSKQKAQMECMIDIIKRYVGFNPKLIEVDGDNDAITIDNAELKDLQKAEYDSGYDKGIKDADEAVHTIMDMTCAEAREYFDQVQIVDIFESYSMSDVIKQCNEYRKDRSIKDLEVGDVIRCKEDDRIVLIAEKRYPSSGVFGCINSEGSPVAVDITIHEWCKCGHIDFVGNILYQLKQLKGDN